MIFFFFFLKHIGEVCHVFLRFSKYLYDIMINLTLMMNFNDVNDEEDIDHYLM